MIAWLLAANFVVGGAVAPDNINRIENARSQFFRIDENLGFTLGQALAAMREGHPLIGLAAAREDAAAAATVAARLWDNPELYAWFLQHTRPGAKQASQPQIPQPPPAAAPARD